MKHLAAALLFALPIVAQQPQPAPFGEKLDVNLVLIDAIVTDNKGSQILGLEKDDFVVKENGVAQPIDTVDYFTNRRLLNAPEQSAPFKVERVSEARYFVVFFDKPEDGQLFDQLALARSTVRDFIKDRLQPGDQVAVVGHDVRLKVYSDFTSDKKQLLAAVEESARFGTGTLEAPKSEGASILRGASRSQIMSRTGTVYEALDVLGDTLRPIRGRKNVILFSPGIVEPGETVEGGVVINRSRYYEPMIHSLNASNVAVYPVQLQRNLAGGDVPAIHQTLEGLAAETSGEYFRYNTSFAPALRKIEQKNNGYYLISYYSHHPKGTTGYQRVQLATKSRELRVQSREGYVYGE